MDRNDFPLQQELKRQEERQELLMVELPNLIHRILHLSMIPLPIKRTLIEIKVEQIKKITNAECDFALNYLKSQNKKNGG